MNKSQKDNLGNWCFDFENYLCFDYCKLRFINSNENNTYKIT
jgi:hypothetical protein